MANLQFPSVLEQKVAGITPGFQALVMEGSHFVATNPTPGTVIPTTTSVVDAGNSGATSAQTRPLMLVGNNYTLTDPLARTIYPEYLRLRITQVPTSATRWSMAMWLDQFASAYTSGGSLIAPVNTNWGVQAGSQAKIYFGAVVAAASTSQARLVNNTTIDTTIPVIGDEYLILFGSAAYPSNANTDSTTQRRLTLQAAAMGISPGGMLKIGMWGASNAGAPSFEFEFAYNER